MGGQAQDGQGPIQPSAERNWPMVPESSALETVRPASGVEPQAERSLRLLRHHRQLPGAAPIPIRSGTAVAQMARPAKLAGAHDMGALRAPAQHLSPPPGTSRAQCVPLSSETIVRGAGCPNWARPDLREPRVGNCPRPPGYSFQPRVAEVGVARTLPRGAIRLRRREKAPSWALSRRRRWSGVARPKATRHRGRRLHGRAVARLDGPHERGELGEVRIVEPYREVDHVWIVSGRLVEGGEVERRPGVGSGALATAGAVGAQVGGAVALRSRHGVALKRGRTAWRRWRG